MQEELEPYMRIELSYGKGSQSAVVNDENILAVLEPNNVEIGLTGEEEVRRAMENPIGTPRLKDIVNIGEKIVIITSDITRPVPSKIIMPVILEELFEAGARAEDITIVFALGSHRKHTKDEMISLVGEDVFQKVKCIDSDPKACISLGKTKSGTPVDIFDEVVNAQRLVLVGNIEYHYFAGYSGGLKAIMPGVSTREAIQANHSKMVEAEAAAGRLDGNPVREDMEEMKDFFDVDFILNVVLDEHKHIIKAVAGHYYDAHRQGCDFLDSLYKVKIPERADIVLVSPGGFPKDINLYQAQKALDNSKHAVKQGGIVILAGSCKEGLGERVFEEWMQWAKSPKDLISRIKTDFRLGGHKAAAIALVLENADIYLVSDLEPDFVESIFFKPFKTVDDALAEAMRQQGEDAKIIVMPYGGSTLPIN